MPSAPTVVYSYSIHFNFLTLYDVATSAVLQSIKHYMSTVARYNNTDSAHLLPLLTAPQAGLLISKAV